MDLMSFFFFLSKLRSVVAIDDDVPKLKIGFYLGLFPVVLLFSLSLWLPDKETVD